MNNLAVPPPARGRRFDLYLAELLPDKSRSCLQKMIVAGEILLNGRRVSVHNFLRGGETITFETIKKTKAAPKPKVPTVPVLAVEKDYLIVLKPAGIAVHPGAGVVPPTLVDSLRRTHPEILKVGEPDRPGIVHRLDKDVSGLMIVARTKTGLAFFKRAFQNREIKKTYLALAHGILGEESGTINRPIARSARRARMAARSPGQEGKEAITHWQVRQRFQKTTLLEVTIETGRTHQIRAHLFAIGHPLVGDPLYKNARNKLRPAAPRLFLHAAALTFTDPQGHSQSYNSPLPKELEEYLEALA